MEIENDDEFDQIGKFNYDKEADTYVLQTNKKGEAKTHIDNIEKGILSDGMDFMNEDNMWEVGGEKQPTVDGFQKFVIDFSDLIVKELAGYYLNHPETPNNVSHIYMGYHVNNKFNKSQKGRGPWVLNPNLQGIFQLHTSWHTHPTYGYSKAERTTYSPGDLETKKSTLKGNPIHIPRYFMILTRGYLPIYY